MTEFSHTDSNGKASMVDVGAKPDMQRTAKAQGFISLSNETLKLINDNTMKKGDVLTVAEIAGIQAAKKAYELIPLCHQLLITKVDVKCSIKEDGIVVNTVAKCNGQTGVEMEALTAAAVALLTIYDMCKAVDKQMIISEVKLIEKTKQ